MGDDADAPVVSVVIPARDEADHLPETLAAVRAMETDLAHEVVVVDGDSDDRTPEIAAGYGARVVHQTGDGIGAGRDLGARHAAGEWIAFVDADTRPLPAFLDRLLGFAREGGFGAVTPRCRVVGDPRGRFLELLYNHVFPRKDRPILPGFALLVRRDAYAAAGGFPDVASEDRAFSRALAAETSVGFCPDVLVETSARRVARDGLVRTALRYFLLDWRTVRDPETGASLSPELLAAAALAVVLAALQVVHGLVLGHGGPLGHLSALPAAAGFLGGIALYGVGAGRRCLLAAGVGFVGFQAVAWVLTGARHGAFGATVAALNVALAGVLALLLVR